MPCKLIKYINENISMNIVYVSQILNQVYTWIKCIPHKLQSIKIDDYIYISTICWATI